MRYEWKHQNASGGGSIHETREAAEAARDEWEERRLDRTGYAVLAPPSPPSVGILRRKVSEWELVDATQ